MGEVTPETVNGLVNAWLWGVDQVDTYGPGLAATGIAWAGWWIRCRVVDRWRARQAARLERQQALDTCNAILRATQTREETEKP